MSALAALVEPADDSAGRHHDWDVVVAHAPVFAVTAWRYLDQLAVSMRPASVDVADNTLRCFARFLVAEHPDLGGGSADLELFEAGEGTIRFDEPTDGVALIAIEAVHAPRQLVFRWATSTRPPTRVDLRLTAMSAQQTRLTLTETFCPRGLAALRVQNCIVASCSTF